MGRILVIVVALAWCPCAAAARWTRPQRLYASSGPPLSVGLAKDRGGDAVAAWVDDSSRLEIAVALRGRAFGPPVVIRGRELIADDGVGVAIDDRGRAIVAAYEGAQAESGSTPLDGVIVVRGIVGRGFSAPATVSLPGEQPTSGAAPLVAITGGTSAVGWDEVGWGSGDSRARVAVARWRRPFAVPVEPPRAPQAYLTGLTVTSGQAVEAVWSHQTGRGGQVFFAAGGSRGLGLPAAVLAVPVAAPFSAAAEFDSRGGMRLQVDAAAEPNAVGPQLTADYRPGGPPVPATPLPGAFGDVVEAPDGGALGASLLQNTATDAPHTRIEYRQAGPGQPFGSARVAPGPNCGYVDQPLAVAVSDSGRGAILAACSSIDQVTGVVYSPAVVAIPIGPGGRPGTRRVLLRSGNGGVPRVAVDGHGLITALWGDDSGLHAERQLGG